MHGAEFLQERGLIEGQRHVVRDLYDGIDDEQDGVLNDIA